MALGLSSKLKKLLGMSEEMRQDTESGVYQPNWGNVDSSKDPEKWGDIRDRNIAARREDNPKDFETRNMDFSNNPIRYGGSKLPGGGGGRVTR